MFNFLPNKVENKSPFHYAFNKIIDWCQRNTLQSSDDIQVTQTSQGTTLKIRKRIAYGGDDKGTTFIANSTWNYRGLWTASPLSPYMTYDVAQMGAGTAAGMYLSTIDGNLNTPDSGIGWVQVSTATGTWL